MPETYIEVIVIINEPANALKEISETNESMFLKASAWTAKNSISSLKFEVYKFILDSKDAGVGLARKIGMDMAAEKHLKNGDQAGIIVCFDADSTCDENYLVCLEEHFKNNPKTPGASIYFEHPVEGNMNKLIYEAIIKYELHLRYYINALRFAGHPFAFQTIGSSMAVRTDAYLAQGRMNKRKAGEDFYFLQKIIPLGNFTEINTTKVIPSPRISDRVPFGTGKAVGDYQLKKELFSYDFSSFKELKQLFDCVEDFYLEDNLNYVAGGLPLCMKQFLHMNDFEIKIREFKSNTNSYINFKSRFFRWFNAFLSLKYIHYARNHFYPLQPISIISSAFINEIHDVTFQGTEKEMLMFMRKIDRTRLN